MISNEIKILANCKLILNSLRMAEELKNIGIDCTVILDSSVGSVMEKIGKNKEERK